MNYKNEQPECKQNQHFSDKRSFIYMYVSFQIVKTNNK